MQFNGHDVLDFWPMALVTGTGLIAWGRLSAKVDAVRKDTDEKASKEVVGQIDARLARMEGTLDRIAERLPARDVA